MQATRDKAKKIVWEPYFYGMVAQCPECRASLGYDYQKPPNFCPWCGQRLEGGEVRKDASNGK